MQPKTDPFNQDLPPYTPNYPGNIPIGQGLYQGGHFVCPQGGQFVYVQGGQVPCPRSDEYPAAVNIYTQQPIAIPLAVETAAGHQVNENRKYSHYLVWSILNTIFCNLIIGAVAIVFSVKVMENPEAPTSASYSKMALVLNVISLVTGLIIWGVSIGVLVQALNQPYY